MRIIKNLVTYSVGDILSKGILLMVSPILTRIFTLQQYGTIPLFMALWGIISVLQYGAMGVSYPIFMAQTNDVLERERIRITGTIVALFAFFLVWISFFLISMTTSYVINYVHTTRSELLFFLFGLIPTSVVCWGTYVFRFQHLALPYVRITLINKVLSVLVAVPFLFLVPEKDRLVVFLIIVFLVNMLSILWMIREFRLSKLDFISMSLFDGKLAKKMISYGIRFIPSMILYSGTASIDRILVGYFASNVEVGILGLALQLSAGVLMVKSWFSLVWDAHLIEWIATKDPKVYMPKLRHTLTLVTLSFFSLVLLSKLWSQHVVDILYPESYQEIGDFIPLIALSGAISVLTLIAVATAIIENTPKYRIRIHSFAFVVNITAGIILIPRIGIEGAIYGTMLSELAILVSWIVIGKYLLKNLQISWSISILVGLFTLLFISFYQLGSIINTLVDQLCLTVLLVAGVAFLVYKNKYYLLLK
ncbi:MAG: hypothetical protein OXH57_03850 [Ekhidna sp.]|nr:hypothetical protein [Ekhidna sp.]